jgi:single-strand selective monofunctional uracil DNA glycosylase
LKDLIKITLQLRAEVARLSFAAPITHVYNPLVYAWAAHRQYLRRFGTATPREIVLVGMNPGPWGMAQTGVPFGAVEMVRDWIGIDAHVGRPEYEHPRRPISGFACTRNEVSGQRVWGWARDTFCRPEKFFARFFIINYCPLCFFERSGSNRTPDKLPRRERLALYQVCDAALKAMAEYLQPSYVVGIGRFAQERVHAVLAGGPIKLGGAPHPSPANPGANRGWARQFQHALKTLGITLP